MVKLAFDPADLLSTSTDPREMPAYTVPEAAWSLRIPVSTVKSWFFGNPGQFERVLTPALPSSRLLSFNNIVETFVLRSLRTKHQIPMHHVRRALDRVETELGQRRPLLHETFRTDGVRLFVEAFGELQDAESGQRPLFDEHLQRIQFEDGLAAQLFPFYYHEDSVESPRAISIDIARCFGRPIVDRICVPTEVIHDRWWAGEQIEELAEDFRCAISDIDQALRYERPKKAA